MNRSRIASVETHLLWVPTRQAIRWEMERALIHAWSEVEVTIVELESGVTGIGETIQNYTWGRSVDHQAVVGGNPFELMWQDRLGAGLQMALLDAAGKEAGVPVARLLGEPCRTHCPVSHWGHDMPPELYRQEALWAVEHGYTSMKIKTRPWFDVAETLELISGATPDAFEIDTDWNDFLLSAPRAIPVLRHLEDRFPKMALVEGPIPAADSNGNRAIRDAIACPVAHHYSDELALRVDQGGCDGYVMAGGVSAVMRGGHAAAAYGQPFFLQMVGTGLTAAMAAHIGSVLSHAQWPAITCTGIYEHDLLSESLEVRHGLVTVPDGPGLGVELDLETLSRFKARGDEINLPARIVTYRQPDGLKVHFANNSHNSSAVWAFFRRGTLPVLMPGVTTTMVDVGDDPELVELHRRVSSAGYLIESD